MKYRVGKQEFGDVDEALAESLAQAIEHGSATVEVWRGGKWQHYAGAEFSPFAASWKDLLCALN